MSNKYPLLDSNQDEIIFSDIDLTGIDFSGRNLSNSDFSLSKGLVHNQFSGSNLCGATFPSYFKFDLSFFENFLKWFRPFTLLILSFCTFCIITTFTTIEAYIIDDFAKAKIPLTESHITIRSLLQLTPFTLLIFQLYYLKFLNRFWCQAAKLPSIFPDNTTIAEKIDSFILSPMISQWTSDFSEQAIDNAISTILSAFLIWGLIPLTLSIAILLPIRREDNMLTLHYALSFLVSSSLSIVAHSQARSVLTRQPTSLYKELSRITLVSLTPSLLLTYGYVLSRNYSDYHFLISQLHSHNTQKKQTAALKTSDNPKLDLSNYILNNCNLNNLNLRESSLTNASLIRINGFKLDLNSAELINSNFTYSNLDSAILTDAKAMRSNFSNTSLRNSTCEYTDFTGSTLTKTNFEYALLTNAILSETRASDAIFNNSNLQNAHIRNSSFPNSFFQSAVLSHANLANTDFSNSNFQNAQLNNTVLEAAFFTNATLIKANISKAHIEGAWFDKANLNGAILNHSFLIGTVLTDATLYDAKITNAHIKDAILTNTLLNKANLAGSTLTNTKLENSNISRANLSGVTIREANLKNSKLRDTDFFGALIEHTNLQWADLKNANFEGAKLVNVNLENADLENAKLSGADISIEILLDACIYDTTTLPIQQWNTSHQSEDFLNNLAFIQKNIISSYQHQ